MTSTDDPRQWESKWHSYIDSIGRARLAMDPDRSDRTRELMAELRELVTETARQMEADDDAC